MPDNTFLFLGLGLAAFMLLRNNQGQTGDAELINASMLSEGTGSTGKALDRIPVVASDAPIGSNGTTAGSFDFQSWWGNLFTGSNVQTAKVQGTTNGKLIVNEDLPNEKIGQSSPPSVAPLVQTPEYIRTTGELAGTAVRQIGLQRGVDVLNDKIYLQAITVDDGEGITRMEGPLVADEDVQIVSGGANPGDPYFTRFDDLVIAKEQGYFGLPTQTYVPQTWQQIESNWDAAHGLPDRHAEYTAPIEERVTVTGGVPVQIDRRTVDIAGDSYDGGWF